MPHDHAHELPTRGARLALVVGLNLTITVAEIIGGILSGSLSLISDALHNFSDGVAVIIAWIAMRLGGVERSDRYTFGLKRAEIVAAVINAGTLVAISVYLYVEAWSRLQDPEPISGAIMVSVAVIGLVANVAGTALLREGSSSNLNLRAAYLHLLSDAVSSLGVILGALAIIFWNITWVDPLLTVAIASYVLWESLKILWQALENILLAAPEGVTLAEVRAALNATPGVSGSHHTHMWQVADGDIHFEAHVTVPDQMLSQVDALRTTLERDLHDRFGIDHTTLQFERDGAQCATRNLT
ncbi:MAG TPA: cation transporter [Aliiroseovarius sp.]|nr:cation transporter [Aliiroseovarius sp.]